MSTPTNDLTEAGVSIWLDDLSRHRLTSGNLAELISARNVTGVTTNPTIFAAALANGADYAEQMRQLADLGVTVEEAIFQLTTDDVQSAADLFRPVYDATVGIDGRVSIEVSPTLANDTAATVAEARRLWAKIDRPNALIKIPATPAGLPAITEVIASGISVNVTLIFSLQRYREVIDAYLTGLEQAQATGLDIAAIHSVASFFVSRVDLEVNERLEALTASDAAPLKSRAGIANARLAYELFDTAFSTERARTLLNAGGNAQRPLWASTGVKDPALPDTLYVTELVADGTVNTMPEKTLEAVHDHGVITGDTIADSYADAHSLFDRLAAIGVDFEDVTQSLEDQGVKKFVASWHELQATVADALAHTPAPRNTHLGGR